jgi:hypothetical protein
MTKNYLLLVFFITGIIQVLDAQTLKKYPIDKSGCSAYFFCNPGKFELSFSPDSSRVYTGECIADSLTYDIICVKMKEQIKDIDGAESMLVQYLDFIKSSFQVTGSTGYGKGHRLKGNENTRGIVDYWKDKDNNNMKVKAWTNGGYIAVLIVIAAKEIPEAKANVFLDGFAFPGLTVK